MSRLRHVPLTRASAAPAMYSTSPCRTRARSSPPPPAQPPGRRPPRWPHPRGGRAGELRLEASVSFRVAGLAAEAHQRRHAVVLGQAEALVCSESASPRAASRTWCQRRRAVTPAVTHPPLARAIVVARARASASASALAACGGGGGAMVAMRPARSARAAPGTRGKARLPDGATGLVLGVGRVEHARAGRRAALAHRAVLHLAAAGQRRRRVHERLLAEIDLARKAAAERERRADPVREGDGLERGAHGIVPGSVEREQQVVGAAARRRRAVVLGRRRGRLRLEVRGEANDVAVLPAFAEPVLATVPAAHARAVHAPTCPVVPDTVARTLRYERRPPS